jgi:hypothetical protein
MDHCLILLPGSSAFEMSTLRAVSADFGWDVLVAPDLDRVVAVQEYRKIMAFLFAGDALGSGLSWLESISLLQLASPTTRLIPCHGFSVSVDWPELSEAGAFHSLRLPLRENELRRTLGFLWESEKRPAGIKEDAVAAIRRSARSYHPGGSSHGSKRFCFRSVSLTRTRRVI